MSYLAIFSTLVAVFLAYRYIALRLSLRNLANEIEAKRISQTNVVLMNPKHQMSLDPLIHEVNQVFNELQASRVLNQQEKKTLDLAIHNITHDIRTPLTIASGFTQNLIRELPEEQERLSKIQENLTTVSQRVEVLLDYQDLLEANVQPKFQQLDLSQALTENLLNYYSSLTEQNFEAEVAIQEGCLIENDPEILQRIFQNIFSNILKHGEKQLTVKLSSNDKRAYVTICNQSQQAIQNLEKLTSRFYSENMSETEKSSGLGLYITKELVELTQGFLTMKAQDKEFCLEITWQLSGK
ncbi:sensor histidine kinase [Candidatus Enterococcus ferrettii]|uniref:histidine kinase n=1 Tax=Candidatus Enterococcus ferrettii TaxID=2815324 RepID=A0ABV0EMA9_9ENTE|nr:HAMP domain-containing sensor histidine kinase [Enterococcus sp. 665A]MBO1339776.1 HAMP domain-containing histidine kinase [Enterococcus sp. 665A]